MSYGALLNFLWRSQMLVGQAFTGEAGEQIEVVSAGEESGGEEALETDTRDALDGGVWLGAEVVVDGERRRGAVMVGTEKAAAGAVLRVVVGYELPMLGTDDRLIPQVRYSIEPVIVERYDALRAGAAKQACAGAISKLDALHRTDLMTALLVRRLQRKTARIEDIFRRSKKDWNQTFWMMLLETMGGNRNREAYSELAERVRMVTVSREKMNPKTVENLIVGAAGLLENAHDAESQNSLEEFRHLALKHSIVPLRAGEWDTARLMPVNHPRNRLRQIAALVAKHDFMLDRVLDCLNAQDVEAVFTLPSSSPGVPLSQSAGRIGGAKAHLIGINLVAPLMFAYGKETGREELCERAVDVLANIPAESNSKLNGWYSGGCVASNAFESQALLELGNEFCGGMKCAECRLGRAEINAVCKKIATFAG